MGTVCMADMLVHDSHVVLMAQLTDRKLGVQAAGTREHAALAVWHMPAGLDMPAALQDLAFYVAAAAGVLLLTSPGGGLASARLPLSGLLLCTGMGERLLRQHLAQWLPLVADGLVRARVLGGSCGPGRQLPYDGSPAFTV